MPDHYCEHFGQLAVQMGFITESQRQSARQVQRGQARRRLLGAVLFEIDAMSAAQIERVAQEVLRRRRLEAPQRSL